MSSGRSGRILFQNTHGGCAANKIGHFNWENDDTVVVVVVVVVVGFWVQRCHSLGPIKRWLEAACPMP
jgi:hypothetical protein